MLASLRFRAAIRMFKSNLLRVLSVLNRFAFASERFGEPERSDSPQANGVSERAKEPLTECAAGAPPEGVTPCFWSSFYQRTSEASERSKRWMRGTGFEPEQDIPGVRPSGPFRAVACRVQILTDATLPLTNLRADKLLAVLFAAKVRGTGFEPADPYGIAS